MSNFIEFFEPRYRLTIIISQINIESLINSANKHYPLEFGGIFIGEVINHKKIIITQNIAPAKFKNSKFSYTRYVDDINRLLEDEYNSSGGKSIYLGEWHSHPANYPSFSHTDFNTIKSISDNIKICINTPIMSIVSLVQSKWTLNFYVYKNGELNRYEKI
ncbi:MAG: hypothetical protein GY756_17865 [bacterium]|nr:hypothetical protein [bacterium]